MCVCSVLSGGYFVCVCVYVVFVVHCVCVCVCVCVCSVLSPLCEEMKGGLITVDFNRSSLQGSV